MTVTLGPNPDKRMAHYWSAHTHSRYSAKDALPEVKDIAKRAAALGWPALGLTDHGTMAGVQQLYVACKKLDVKPLPGTELYITPDAAAKERRSSHLTVLSTTEAGYQNLVRLTTVAHRHFLYRPRVDLADIADLAESGYTSGLAVGTGCRSGLVVRTLIDRGPTAAQRVAENLAMWFPTVYVELMNHGIDSDGRTDDEITDALVAIARAAGLPILITGDSHYVDVAETPLHDTMKELLTFAENPEDGRFDGAGYHLVDDNWLAAYFEPKILDEGIANLAALAESASVRIPDLDTFTLKVPDVTLGGDPDDELGERVLRTLEEQFPGDEVYAQRAVDELAVIAQVNFAGYLLFAALITDHMLEQGIWFHCRGSAAGSLVLYLLRITQMDPVARGIRMDRFLSGDRTTPPDIDLDIEADRREYMIGWVASRYAVRQVATYSTFSLDENAAEQTGSLKVEYWSTVRKRRVAVNDFTKIDDKERIPPGDWTQLVALSERRLIKNTGKNAAGFVVADSDAALDTLPLVRIGKGGSLVTAYDKDDVEAFGYPKIDLLGLTMLYGMRLACTWISPEDPRGFWESIPEDDRDALARAGAGDTLGMFQLEGYSQRKGLEDLDPKRTDDIIAAQALFRPGVSRDFLNTYLRRRRGQEQVPVMHPDIAGELAPTYGVAIFQEQVVGVLRSVGMEPAALNGMLKAVKASGKAGLLKAQEAVTEALPEIIALATARGWGNDDVVWLEHALTDYGAGYSFGKAHSTTYGVVAYRTSWLACHEPLAFWSGILIAYTGHTNAKGKDMELAYAAGARKAGMRVLPTHVNHSRVDYQPNPEDNTIRRGLVSIPHVGRGAAEEIAAKAPYSSVLDFGRRCATSKVTGVKDLALGKAPLECGPSTAAYNLAAAGAFKDLPST